MTQIRRHQYALEMTLVGKRFNQNWVLKDVNLKVHCGSIHAIVGHNGAGKSTLMKIALGGLEPTEGEVRIGGRRLTYSRPAEARTLGLGMVMQERSLITTMTGIDNLFLNCERLNALGCVDVRREREEIEGMIGQLGIKPSTLLLRVSDMRTIEQELIEIAKALRLGNQVLVLDEPTAPLGRDEISKLFDVLRAIADRGTGIVLITHDLPEVFALSDEVTCLRDGNVVMSCPTAETDMAHLISAMLGGHPSVHARSHGRVAHHQQTLGSSVPASGPERVPVLTVRNLCVGTKLSDVSFDAFAGEVLGIVGLAGSGRTTLLRTLFGDLRAGGGELRLFHKPYRPKSPWDAIAHHVFLIPQDRSVHGLVLSQSIADNIMIVALRRLLNRLKLLKFADGREHARRMMKTLDIRASGAHQPVGELSGGNQQKVVLAKALTVGCRLLLLDEPTFGLDIAATREIMMQVRNLAEEGSAVLWVSSDLLEITEIADRIVILRDGIVCATVGREDQHAFNEHSLSATIQRRQLH
jgi:ABC-type sugar transport system ATPase subunit